MQVRCCSGMPSPASLTRGPARCSADSTDHPFDTGLTKSWAQAYESRSMRGMYRLKSEGGMGAPPPKVKKLDENTGVEAVDIMDTADIQKPMNGSNGHVNGSNGHTNGSNGVAHV